MATHSSILAWEIPWTEESFGLQSMGSQELGMIEQLNQHLHYHQYCMAAQVYAFFLPIIRKYSSHIFMLEAQQFNTFKNQEKLCPK